MYRTKLLIRVFLIAVLAGGVTSSAPEGQLRQRQRRGQSQARQLRIVATTPELASMAAAIAGANARVNSITTGREDPHFLQARPTFMVLARDADLWLRMGLELEIGWEPLLLDGARNPSIRPGQTGHFDGGAYAAYVLDIRDSRVTRAQGDVHPSGNPHYLLDPFNGRAVAVALASRLMEVDPANKAAYEAGLADFLEKLDSAMFGAELVKKYGGEHVWKEEISGTFDSFVAKEGVESATGGWKAAMRPARDTQIITFHKSFTYFAHRFGLVIASELEPVPGVPPSPAHLAGVIEQMNAEKIGLILMEPFYPRKPADFVAGRTNARVAVVSSYATNSTANGYLEMIDAIVNAVANSR